MRFPILLETLLLREKLTVAGAAPESSLTVEEAHRMLQALVAKDHFKDILEHGRLLCALWGATLLHEGGWRLA